MILAKHDCNNNGVPDDLDLSSGTSQDCNANGIPDECDIASGFSLDCNSNGMPDECDADCNANGIPDDCDITLNTSDDLNSNGIPDECESIQNLTQGTFWATLQIAADNANHSDVIEVQPGQYQGVTILHGHHLITIQGSDINDLSTVRSTNIGPVTVFSSVVLQGVSPDRLHVIPQKPDRFVLVYDCVFDGTGGITLGDISVHNKNHQVDVFRCRFEGLPSHGFEVFQNKSPGYLIRIFESIFVNNLGAGAYYDNEAVRCVVDCTFGFVLRETLTISNSLFLGNTGPGVHLAPSSFADNFPPVDFCLNNNIFADLVPILYFAPASIDSIDVDVSSNLIVGGHPQFPSNIDADPLFTDSDGPDDNPATIVDNDYTPLPGSPLIDSGDNAASILPTDLLGNPRIVNGTVDIGPIEYQGPPPCVADLAAPFGVLNFFDVSAFIGLYTSSDPAADLAAPFGVFNFFDVSAFIAAFNAGCP